MLPIVVQAELGRKVFVERELEDCILYLFACKNRGECCISFAIKVFQLQLEFSVLFGLEFIIAYILSYIRNVEMYFYIFEWNNLERA